MYFNYVFSICSRKIAMLKFHLITEPPQSSAQKDSGLPAGVPNPSQPDSVPLYTDDYGHVATNSSTRELPTVLSHNIYSLLRPTTNTDTYTDQKHIKLMAYE